MRDLIEKKRLNPMTLQIYINKVQEAKVAPSQLMNYIDSLNILPDFLDSRWPYKKKYMEDEFVKKITSLENAELAELVRRQRQLDSDLEKVKQTSAVFDKLFQELSEVTDSINDITLNYKTILERFLSGDKRDIYVNVARPTKRLFA